MLTESEARVLATLAVNPAQSFTAKEIAAEAGISAPTVRATAKWLEYAGLLWQVQEFPATWRISDSGRRIVARMDTDFPVRGGETGRPR
ncbi:MAG: MarR family transcriptional regulator [Mycobacterium sp.]|nr:MarR family transcriptional regulator [Mycobacterium sp.]